MTTVLLLTGASQGDALGGIARSFKSLFNEAGYDFTEIHFGQSQTAIAELNATLQRGNIAFAFSFMSMGSELSFTDSTGQTANLWERLRIPFLSIYGDSPAYFFDRHVAHGSNFASLYGFPEHATLRNRLPNINGPIGTVPPILLDLTPRETLDFSAKTAGKLLFLKNGNDPEALRQTWHASLRGAPLEALQDLASELAANLASPRLNQIDDLVLDYGAAENIDIARLPKLRLFLIAQLDDYTRRLKSTLIARSLLDFPVEIRGTGWEHLDFSGRRAICVPVCDYAESRQLIRDCLGVLDMSPNTAGAPHDRVARAFGSYTLCLTNAQSFLPAFAPCFRFTAESIQSAVAEILANPARGVELGASTAEAFRAQNPPETGITHMIKMAELARLNQRTERLPEMPPYQVWPPKTLS